MCSSVSNRELRRICSESIWPDTSRRKPCHGTFDEIVFNVQKSQKNHGICFEVYHQRKNKRKRSRELSEAELWLFKWSQQTLDKDKLDKGLIPSENEQGLLCALGRLENIRSLPNELRNPIILPKGHRLVHLLLDHLHKKRAHCGNKSLIYEG